MCIFDWYMYQPFQPDPIFTSLISGLLGSAIGGFATYKAVDKAHEHNIELEKLKEAEEEKSILKLLNNSYKQLLIVLNGTFNPKNKSSYGYIRVAHHASLYLIPVLDGVMYKIGLIEDEEKRNTIIEIYSDLKHFLDCNELYKDKLKSLKNYRKENLNQDILWDRNLLDYFDIDEVLIEEQNKSESKISYEFFKYQDVLLKDLIKCSNYTEDMYIQLKMKIEKFLEMGNE